MDEAKPKRKRVRTIKVELPDSFAEPMPFDPSNDLHGAVYADVSNSNKQLEAETEKLLKEDRLAADSRLAREMYRAGMWDTIEAVALIVLCLAMARYFVSRLLKD